MTNDNNAIRAKHLEAIANAAKQFTLDKVNVLTNDYSAVEGKLWFDFDGDLPVLKLCHDGAEFTVGHVTAANAVNASLNGNVVSVPNATFTITGLANNLTLYKGKFFANTDTTHTQPFGSVNALFNDNSVTGYSFTLNSLDALNSSLSMGDKIFVTQSSGKTLNCYLNISGLTGEEIDSWSMKRYKYTYTYGTTDKFIKPVIDKKEFIVISGDSEILKFRFSEALEPDLFDGNQLSEEGKDYISAEPWYDENTHALLGAKFTIKGNIDGIFYDDNPLLDGTKQLAFINQSTDADTKKYMGYVSYTGSGSSTLGSESFAYNDAGTYTYTRESVGEGYYTAEDETYGGVLKHTDSTIGGDSFAVTGLVSGLSLNTDKRHVWETAGGESYGYLMLNGVSVGNLLADGDRNIFTITSLSALDIANVQAGQSKAITLTDNDPYHSKVDFLLEIAPSLIKTPETIAAGFSGTNGTYKFTSSYTGAYITNVSMSGGGWGASAARTTSATYYAKTIPDKVIVSGLSTNLGALSLNEHDDITNTAGTSTYGYIDEKNKTFFLRSNALTTGGVSISGGYSLGFDTSDKDTREAMRDFSKEKLDSIAAGSYRYTNTAATTTVGYYLEHDRKNILYNSVELKNKSFDLSGLRSDLGTLSFNQFGQIETANNEIIGKFVGGTITLYPNAMPTVYPATLTNADAEFSLILP